MGIFLAIAIIIVTPAIVATIVPTGPRYVDRVLATDCTNPRTAFAITLGSKLKEADMVT